MKKIIFITVLMLFFSCKTKELAVSKTLDEVKINLKERTKTDVKTEVKNTTEISEDEVKELYSLLQNLNINYDGKELSDKLDFLLKKTEEGTKLTIQGKGSAKYSENNKREFESFKTEIFKRQDSLYLLQAQAITSLKADIYHFEKKKDKIVEVKGFQFGFYVWLFLLIIVILILSWIAKKFKLFDKFKTKLNAKGG